MADDIRCIQRLNNWTRALNQLSKFMKKTALDELQEQGLIQSFEYNHELAWMEMIKDRNLTSRTYNEDATKK